MAQRPPSPLSPGGATDERAGLAWDPAAFLVTAVASYLLRWRVVEFVVVLLFYFVPLRSLIRWRSERDR